MPQNSPMPTENSAQAIADYTENVRPDPYKDRNSIEFKFRSRRFVRIQRLIETILSERGKAEILDLGGREDLVSTLSVLAMDEMSPATVLVSHHVEEIPPGFTHGMLLREGRVVASGPVEEVVTAEALSDTFGMSLQVSHNEGRWTARRRVGRHSG